MAQTRPDAVLAPAGLVGLGDGAMGGAALFEIAMGAALFEIALFEVAVGGMLVAQASKQMAQKQTNDQAIEMRAPAIRGLPGRASAHIPIET